MQSRHRRQRSARALERKNGNRPSIDRLLIVCEGKKSEPNYFEDIRKELHLARTSIRVLHGKDGTEPRQIVDCAEATFLESREFDIIYAVFDRDVHRTYHDALARAAQLDQKLRNDYQKKVRFHAVPSIPCFELWLLLHFSDIKAFADRYEIIARLRTFIPGYEKGSEGVLKKTASRLEDAIPRAAKLCKASSPEQDTELFTKVGEVVEKIYSYRQKR